MSIAKLPRLPELMIAGVYLKTHLRQRNVPQLVRLASSRYADCRSMMISPASSNGMIRNVVPGNSLVIQALRIWPAESLAACGQKAPSFIIGHTRNCL